jgi:hypothetical protein
MAIKVCPISTLCIPPVSVAQGRTRVGAPSREGTNQMSVWLRPEGTLVPLSINGGVSLVTLDWGMPPTLP